MKRARVLMLFLILPFMGIGQENVDLKETFLDAEYYLLYEDFREALPLYLRLTANGMENAYIHYRIGQCYLQIPGQKDKSIDYLEKASHNIGRKVKEGSFRETKAPLQTLFYLGNAYQVNNKLDEAIDHYEQFKAMLEVEDIYNIDFVNQQIEACKNAREFMTNPIQFQKENLGTPVNDNFPAIRPIVSADEDILLYTKRLQFYDAIFYTTKKENAWSTPVNITPQIQSDGDLYTSSLSNDGKTLILFRNEASNGDLYISRFNEQTGRWSRAERLPRHINTEYWETHGVLSAEGDVLYFTSDRKGGYGGLDIYYSIYSPRSNSWTEPVNLGPEINTPYNEESPFLSKDGTTLYFSSQGHESMGGYDIFYAKNLGGNNWSEPVNIGYPLNTTDDDLFFQPAENGIYAYMSDYSTEGYGEQDLFRYEIFSPENPMEIQLLGTLKLADNQKEFPEEEFQVLVRDTITNEVIATLSPDTEEGTFSTKLTPGTYNIQFRSKFYKDRSQTLYIPDNYQLDEIRLTTELTPLAVTTGEYVTIRSIFFEFDKAALTRDAQIELERLANLMEKYPSLYIEVIGHTDAKGAQSYNYKLSLQRARSAINYLVDQGIKQQRFVAKGAGSNQPLAINKNADGSDNPDGRKYNRRVELKILKSDKKIILQSDFEVPENLKVRDLTYTIFLLKLDDKLPESYFNEYPEFSAYKLQEHEAEGKFFYTLGSFKNKSEAIKIFNTALDYGFGEAEIISSYDLKEMLNPATSARKTAANIAPGQQYTIQLLAVKSPVKKGYFSKITDVEELTCKDGYYRYITGTYTSWNEARKKLDEIINKGFQDAFIMNLDHYEPLKK
ncbi:MAG: OmpA family protein [Bacteroidales bacterium]